MTGNENNAVIHGLNLIGKIACGENCIMPHTTERDQVTCDLCRLNLYQQDLISLESMAAVIVKSAPVEVQELAGRLYRLVRLMCRLVDKPILVSPNQFDEQSVSFMMQQYRLAIVATNAVLDRERQLLTSLRGNRETGNVLQIPPLPTRQAVPTVASAVEATMVALRSEGVVYIGYHESRDWTDEPSIFFRVLIANRFMQQGTKGQRDDLRFITHYTREQLQAQLDLVQGERRNVYINFRTEAENNGLGGDRWKEK